MASVQRLLDKQDITETICKYGKALDEKKFEILSDVFTDRAQMYYTWGEKELTFKLRDAIELFKSFLYKCYWTSHFLSVPLIDLHENEAQSSTRIRATHIQITDNDTPNAWILSGSYEDELVRTDAGWRIHKRILSCPYEKGEFLKKGVKEFKSPPSTQDPF